MSQPYKSGRQQNLNLGITSVTESKTVLQTIGKVGIGTTNAQNHSLFVVGSTNITGDVYVGGASTFVGVGTFGDSLYVANQLYVAGVNVSGGASIGQDITTRNLLATGISTFTGIVDANGGLDVTGHTELDDLNVTGIATIQNLNVQTGFDVYDTTAVFHNNVRIDGNLSIGGTASVIIAQDLNIIDKEITLGITTDAFGNDISNDVTANHGGISIASTVGSPLVDLALVGFSSLPKTYKQLMWVAANSYGVGTTDAWMFNYAVGIGSTLVPNGVRFAVKGIQFTDDTISAPNLNLSSNLNVTGITTLASAGGITTTGGDLFVGGDLYVKDDIFFDEFNARNAVLTGNLSVAGVSTFTGLIDSNGDLDVTGHTELDNVNVSGVSTFSGLIDANGGADITGSVALNNSLIVSGISTFSAAIDANGGATIDNIQIGITNDNEIDTVTDNLTLDSAGGTVTIDDQLIVSGITTFQGNVNLGDNDKILLGDSNDLEIYHDGSDSYIRDVGTGDLLLTTNGTQIRIRNGQDGEDMANFVRNAQVELYYDNSKKFETLGAGATVTGTLFTNQISVSGVSTFVGVVTTSGDLYVGGDLYVADDLVFDEATVRNINVTGVSTLGIASATTLYVSGISTFIKGPVLIGSGTSTGTASQRLQVTGGAYISDNVGIGTTNPTEKLTVYGTGVNRILVQNPATTPGNFAVYDWKAGSTNHWSAYVPSTTNLWRLFDNSYGLLNDNGLRIECDPSGNVGILTSSVAGSTLFVRGNFNVSGASTFAGITTVTGPTLFTKQLDVLGVATFRSNAHFGDSDVLNFGDGNDLQIYHDGTNSVVRDFGVGSLILGSDGVGVDIYNITQGEYQARFNNNGAVELYYDSIKRLETTGYGITVYNTIQAPQLNITGIGTIDGVTISSGIITSSQPGVTTIKYYGDGSNLFGVNAFNVINQVLTASPVYPTFANNIGVTSIGIADTEIGFIPTSGNLGIGSTNPTAKLQVIGNVLVSGIVTARQFVGNVNAGVATIGLATVTSGFIDSLTAGIATVNKLDVNQISPDGVDYGSAGYFPKANGSGGWSWADVPGLFSVNNILNGFNVSDEGLIVGTAGSITQLDFRGNNIVAFADPQPNGIATVRVSDTPDFTTLNVSGISTFAGITTVSGSTLFAQQLSVAGVSTFIGVSTFASDLFVGGDLYVKDDIIFDSFTAREITVTDVSNIGVSSARQLNVTGVTTTALLNVGVGGTIITTTNTTRVGINSISPNFTLDVNGDINFNGTLYQNNSPFIASRWSAGLGNDIYRLNGDVGIGTTNPQYTLEVSGNARISGVTSVTNLEIYGSVSAGTTTGANGQYLKSTGVGVTWADFPTLRTTGISTATEGQTSFSFSYNVGFVDVYVNGVKLTASEFNASNGSSVVLNSPAYENDIVEFIGYNTVSTSGSGGAIASLNDLTDVTLTTPASGETLTYDGTQWVNDYTVTASTSTTSQTAIHTLSSATYRSVEYTIQATQGLKYHLTKVLAVHDGLLAYPTEYGTVYTIDSLGAFDVDISGGNIRLLVTPSAATTTNYKIKFTAFKV